MGCIETLIILSVATFHLPVMPWGKGTDDFVADPVHFQVFLEKSGLLPVGGKTVGEFGPIIGLDALDRTGKGLHQMIYKLSGRIGAVLLKCLHETPAGILVDGRVLEKLLSDHLGVFQTGRWNKFHIDLDALSGMIHLFIGFRDVLWVRRMYSHDPLFPEKTVKARNGAGVAALAEFNPEDDQTVMRISAAHIADEADLIIRMLVGVVMGSAGAVSQGIPGTVIAAFPAVDILPVGFVFYSSFCDPKSFRVLNQG